MIFKNLDKGLDYRYFFQKFHLFIEKNVMKSLSCELCDLKKERHSHTNPFKSFIHV